MFVEVAVNIPPVHGTFDYHVPEPYQDSINVGQLVIVPFGKRQVQGIITRCMERSVIPETKPIDGILDPHPVVTEAQLQLAAWMADEYHSALIDALTLMLPPGLSQPADSLYSLSDEDVPPLGQTESRLIALLQKRGPLRGRQIARAMSRQNWKGAADALIRREAIKRESVLDPPRARPRKVRFVRLSASPQQAQAAVVGRSGTKSAQRRRCMLDMLIRAKTPLDVSAMYAECGGNSADLRHLEGLGLIALSELEIWRDPLADLEFVPSSAPVLTSDQSQAWERIQNELTKEESATQPAAILLHGVTGSGKTEIYLRAVDEVLHRGGQAIVLVPEIALTPQTVRRFLARFQGQVGLSHSQLSDGERFDTWRRCRTGQIGVMVGPRSALFAPMPDLKLIVLDESHDESYKESERAPRYHAREVALRYSKITRGLCLFGTATPDIVTYNRSERGEVLRIDLPQRIHGHKEQVRRRSIQLGASDRFSSKDGDAFSAPLPPVQVIDMRLELKAGNRSIFSRKLKDQLAHALSADQQAILFLNRRGSATYVFCRDCGWVARCPKCETTLTYHPDQESLLCHHCGHRTRSPSECPNCSSQRVRHFGAGTVSVVQELERELPGARALRWDWDVTRSKGAHDAILESFSSHKADVLIGTQMLAKGLDLPLVTVVGVISADVGLNLPDFRAGERTFQILTQVAGRAGRSHLGGQVILQTYQPDHYVVQAAAHHDYQSFYQQELRFRKQLEYPPYHRLTRLVLQHTSNRTAERLSNDMATQIKARAKQLDRRMAIIGPAPCFYQRLRGLYRWQIVLRTSHPQSVLPETLPEGWSVDVDPVSLL